MKKDNQILNKTKNLVFKIGALIKCIKRQKVPDTYIISFPKSGQTWLTLMLIKIYSDLNRLDPKQLLKPEEMSKLPFEFDHGLYFNRLVREDYFPKLFYKKKKILFLVRDPRDVVVSYYYHSRYRLNFFHGRLNEFLHFPFNKVSFFRLTAPPFGIRPIINYLNNWLEASPSFNDFKVFYYEDFCKNPAEQLRLVCEYLGLEVSQEIISEAVSFAEFKNMRKMEKENSLNWIAFRGSGPKEGFRTRKGIVGGYKTELEINDIKFIDQEINKHLNPYFKRYKYESFRNNSNL